MDGFVVLGNKEFTCTRSWLASVSAYTPLVLLASS